MTPGLMRVLHDVEALAKEEMYAMQRSDLFGNCVFDPLTPTVIRYRSILTEECCIHELLHAKLWHSGFGFLRLRNPYDPNESLRHIASMLNGTFHHAIIFPKLLDLGIDPKENESRGVRSFLAKLITTSEPQDSFFNPLVAVVYSRAKLETTLSQIDEEFASEHLRPGKQLGIQLVAIVDKYAIDDQRSFNEGLRKAMVLLQMQSFLQFGAPTPT